MDGHILSICTKKNFKRLFGDCRTCLSNVVNTFVAPVKTVNFLLIHLAALLEELIVSLSNLLDRKEEVVALSASESERLLTVGATELYRYALSMH